MAVQEYPLPALGHQRANLVRYFRDAKLFLGCALWLIITSSTSLVRLPRMTFSPPLPMVVIWTMLSVCKTPFEITSTVIVRLVIVIAHLPWPQRSLALRKPISNLEAQFQAPL